MSKQTIWTSDMDTALRRSRAAGDTWAQTEAKMGLTKSVLCYRASELRIPQKQAEHWKGPSKPPAPRPESPDRPPLPPGSDLTWGLIVAGSCLEGVPYRYRPPIVTVSRLVAGA